MRQRLYIYIYTRSLLRGPSTGISAKITSPARSRPEGLMTSDLTGREGVKERPAEERSAPLGGVQKLTNDLTRGRF